jgi:aconitate hydratase
MSGLKTCKKADIHLELNELATNPTNAHTHHETLTVSLIAGDNITTDDIFPLEARRLPYRTNLKHLAEYCFKHVDPHFTKRAGYLNANVIVSGESYGMGFGSDHDVVVPIRLGVKVIIAKSFAPFHKAKLIRAGILPIVFVNTSDYDRISLFDELRLEKVPNALKAGAWMIHNLTSGETYEMSCSEADQTLSRMNTQNCLDCKTLNQTG